MGRGRGVGWSPAELAAVARGVQQVTGDGLLVCLECGRSFRQFGQHVVAAHQLPVAVYRAVHGLPAGYGLHCEATRAARAERGRRLWQQDPQLRERLRPTRTTSTERAELARRARAARLGLSGVVTTAPLVKDGGMEQLPRLRVGVSAKDAAESIQRCVDHARQVNSRPVPETPSKMLRLYNNWVTTSETALDRVMERPEVERFLFTSRHDYLHAADPAAHSNLIEALHREVHRCMLSLQDAATTLVAQTNVWTRTAPDALILADTNVYLQHRLPFDEIDWRALVQPHGHGRATLVVPLLVVDELDGHKRQETRSRARTSLRTLHDLFNRRTLAEHGAAPLLGAHPNVRARLLMDPPGHQRDADPDLELIDRAGQLAVLAGREVYIATFDVGMEFRVDHLGPRNVQTLQLPAQDYETRPGATLRSSSSPTKTT